MKTFYTENSSRVVALEYDELKEELTITFKRGGIYKYHGVPEETYDGLVQAKSIGAAIDYSIKGKFKYEKLS
jgi:hypothetical protein